MAKKALIPVAIDAMRRKEFHILLVMCDFLEGRGLPSPCQVLDSALSSNCSNRDRAQQQQCIVLMEIIILQVPLQLGFSIDIENRGEEKVVQKRVHVCLKVVITNKSKTSI